MLSSLESPVSEAPPLPGTLPPVRGKDGFFWSESPEPHQARRKALLAAHPEIRELYGPCPRTKYITTALVAAQLACAFLLKDAPFWVIAVFAYAVGGVMNQMLLLAIHELSHNLAFKKPVYNRLFGLFINLPIGLPVAAAFREYHLIHHTHQGVDGLDTDVPTVWESRWVKGKARKFFWLIFQGLAYALRPLFMMPLKPNRWIIANFAVQAAFDVAVYQLFGLKALLYFPLSTLIVMGLHPIAGHYIAEHYLVEHLADKELRVKQGQETYSYYGPLNVLAFNVGYHNEHHDFPYIAGSRLPALRKLAPEFYETLHQHTSWTRSLWDFVFKDEMSAKSRVKRAKDSAG